MAKGSTRPPASFGAGDIGVLNYALTLEYLEAAFYDAAAKNNVAKGDKQLMAFLKTAKFDEDFHVKLLKGALGSKAAKKPKFDFGQAVAQIATVEARHSGAIGIYLGKAIAPKPLDTPLAASAVLKAVAGTGFIKG